MYQIHFFGIRAELDFAGCQRDIQLEPEADSVIYIFIIISVIML